jgi:hypothetical protein
MRFRIRGFLTPGSGNRDGEKSGSKVPESGMNISDHFSKSFETVFWLKILKLKIFDADPESFWIRDGKNQIRDSGLTFWIFNTDEDIKKLKICWSLKFPGRNFQWGPL